MQKLLLSKLASSISKKLSNPSSSSSSIILQSKPYKTFSPPFHHSPRTSSATKHPFNNFSHSIPSILSSSCLSKISALNKIRGVFSNPLLSRHLLISSLSRAPGKSPLKNCNVVYFKGQLSRKSFDLDQLSRTDRYRCHVDVGHLVSNMFGLYFFSTSIAGYFEPEYLLKLYLAGAIDGSIFYLVHHAFMSSSSKRGGLWNMDPSRTPGLGASGAVNAIMLLNIFLFPKATLYFDFIVPVPAILLGIFLIGKDILRMIEGDSRISGSAHLGGAVVAALAWRRVKMGCF